MRPKARTSVRKMRSRIAIRPGCRW
ncbi:hypothetical protein ACHMW6_03380 [Pseudoduganella sp. UC29_106]